MLTKENLKNIAINTKDVKVVEVDLKKTNMFSIGQQFNNEVLVIHFINLPNLVNKYIYYKIDDIEEEVPLVSDVFIVSRPLMLHSGEVKAQIIARNPNTSMVELTQNFIMRIKPSNYSGIGEDENYPDDPNIKNYYVKIDGKIQSMDELIALVQSKLDKGEFVGAQGPKGEKGEPGKKGEPGDVTEEFKNLANQIAQNASDAQASATNAQVSATNAQKILDDTKEFANQTKSEMSQIKTDTNTLKEQANTSAVNAKASEDKAKEYANNLKESTDAISQNTKAISELADKKITKFYASNQGETHVTDSDNGKIMDMMLYGQSEQNQYRGKNLLKIRDGTQTLRGVTVTAKDGVIALKGTATESGYTILDIDSFVLDGTYTLSDNIHIDPRLLVLNKSFEIVLEQKKTATLENAEVSKLSFVITEGKTYNISNILIQIEKGSEVTSYEPYVGGKPSPSPDYPQEIKRVVNPTFKVTNEDGLKVQSVTLNNITLNAIPVSSDGNVTIDGQQYIADYVDVVRGKVVRKVDSSKLDNTQSIIDKTEWLLAEQQETDLTTEQIQALKELATYYHVTNISVTSDQLYGYTVFNYPISLANGWNYVKQQLNDNRDYIYDMDIQSAEAYVNSEYAVTLTELEV